MRTSTPHAVVVAAFRLLFNARGNLTPKLADTTTWRRMSGMTVGNLGEKENRDILPQTRVKCLADLHDENPNLLSFPPIEFHSPVAPLTRNTFTSLRSTRIFAVTVKNLPKSVEFCPFCWGRRVGMVQDSWVLPPSSPALTGLGEQGLVRS